MNKKILFIEDEQVQIELMMRELEKQFKALHAPTGEEGLELALEKKPDLIVLDLFLPGIKGQEVIKELEDNSKTADIPIIIFTHLEDQDIKKRIEKKENIEYLQKQKYNSQEVIEKIKEKLT